MRSVLPRAVRELSNELTKLPGIGPKSARRLSIHLLQQPRTVVAALGDALKNLHANVRICEECFNLSEREWCEICRDQTRQVHQLCVVESPLDVEAIERTEAYHGLYHVLGGVLSPIEGVTADQLTLAELQRRMTGSQISELIIGLNQTIESEATARHITHLAPAGMKVTRLGRGLPTGGDIEFADAVTIQAAFEGRRQIPIQR